MSIIKKKHYIFRKNLKLSEIFTNVAVQYHCRAQNIAPQNGLKILDFYKYDILTH